jgi:hypothetical protein
VELTRPIAASAAIVSTAVASAAKVSAGRNLSH